jgi:molybdate transport system permease protein
LAAYLVLLLAALGRLAVVGPARGGPADIGALLVTSLTAAGLATAGALLIGVPAALWLARSRFRGKALVSTLLDLPTMLSPVAIGTALVLFLRAPPGSWLEGSVGLLFAFWGVVAAQMTVVTALVVRAAEAAFAAVDPGLERVAELYGASRITVLRKVTLPMAAPGLLAAAVLAFARALGEFGATATVAGTIPGRTETLATGIALALESGDLAGAARLSLLLVAVAAIVLLVLRRLARTAA